MKGARPKQFLKLVSRRGPLRVLKRLWISITPLAKKAALAISWAFRNSEDSNFYYDLSDRSRNNMAHTLATIFGVSRDTILGYFAEIEESEELLRARVRLQGLQKSMRDSALSPGRRAVWYAIARIKKPKVVLETGVHQGLGALTLILAISKNFEETGIEGKYIGTDLRSDAGILAKLSTHSESFDLRVGDSIDSISALELTIDMYVSDSDHFEGYERRELESVAGLLSDQAVIISDNAHATSVLSDWCAEANRKFVFLDEVPLGHWYSGAGVGISWS